MDYIATGNGRVGHIVSSVVVRADGREVTTVCGKTYNEAEIGVNNDLDVCSACEGKEEKLVEAAPDVVLTPEEVETEPADEEEKSTSSKKK